MKIVLLGYMGSGKTTVGKRLSVLTGLPYVDLDHYIEEKENLTISEIFNKKGEIYFRKKEATYLFDLLVSKEKIILSTGGGTPCYGNVMQRLVVFPETITLYLNCSVQTLTKRLWKEKKHRPLIAHLESKLLLNDFIRKHLFERAYFYNQAKITIKCDDLKEQEITEKILLQLL